MKKVILIDDNTDILTMWKMFLDKQNYDAITMESGKQFKAYLEENETLEGVGCVVCDQNLKDDLGSNLFQLLQSRDLHVPFVIISGYSEAEISKQVESPGKLQILKKPISLHQLKEVIDSSFNGNFLNC